MRFLVDHMLVKLGKYLRILGYDAEWDPDCRTQDLIRRANREGRVFLTRNQRISTEYPAPDRWLAIEACDPVEQLQNVVESFGLDPSAGLFSRCIRCNVPLETIPEKTSIQDRVHPNVFARHEVFYTCPNCHTVFWKGSHVGNTCRKLRSVLGPIEGFPDG